MSMAKRIFVLASAAVLALTGLARADDTTGVTDTSIKIGIPGPLSGDMASSGAAAYGVAAIYKWVNDNGGINGRKIDIVLGDDSCNEAKGVALAKRMIFDDKVFLINGNICSGPALAMKPVIEEAGVPWVISTAVNQNLAIPTVKTTFTPARAASTSGTRWPSSRSPSRVPNASPSSSTPTNGRKAIVTRPSNT